MAASKGKREERIKEWKEILKLAETNTYFALWISTREGFFKNGESVDTYTRETRKEYRLFMAGDIDASGRRQ